MKFIKIFFIVFFSLFLCFDAHAKRSQGITDEAQKLYQKFQESVYQIQIIDLATSKKAVIGSGFRFSKEGHIATNYHVISHVIRYPERYKIKYLDHENNKGFLEIINVDVIHDLAILKGDNFEGQFFELGESSLLKGARIFSMGNPYDLGMTIVEGTYNGLMEKSLYRKILFSGSLNSGMSGGPALDRAGKVIGVNVSTHGNQVSFLVPVEFLNDLFRTVQAEDFKKIVKWNKHIEQQLVRSQDDHIEELLSSEWDSLPIGNALVPGEMSEVIKCWGDSKMEEDLILDTAMISCFSEDGIFISEDFSTGKIIYKYVWLTSEGINPIRFYKLYESYYGDAHYFHNAYKEDATNFNCNSDFVVIDGVNAKVSLCARRYKKYPKLHDIELAIASVDKMDKGLFSEVVILGISKNKALEFIRKFLGEIHWQD